MPTHNTHTPETQHPTLCSHSTENALCPLMLKPHTQTSTTHTTDTKHNPSGRYLVAIPAPAISLTDPVLPTPQPGSQVPPPQPHCPLWPDDVPRSQKTEKWRLGGQERLAGESRVLGEWNKEGGEGKREDQTFPFFFESFLWLHPGHMEIPRLGGLIEAARVHQSFWLLFKDCPCGLWRFPGLGVLIRATADLDHSHSNVGV